MNKKDIESRIKLEASKADIPDLKQQILAQVPNRKIVLETKKKKQSLSLKFSYVFAALTLVLVCLLMISKIDSNKPLEDNEEPSIDTPVEDVRKVSNAQKAYANGVATLSGFIGSVDSTVMSAMANFIGKDYNHEDATSEINKYFNSVLQLLDEGSREYKLEELTDGDYQYKLTVINTVLGDSYETVIYYNETPKDNKKHDDLDEVSTLIVGVIIQNDKVYNLSGEKEVEIEGNEKEVEIELILKISDNAYIAVSQEIENHEKEYEYKFYNDNPKHTKPYKVLEVEIETNDDETQVELSVKENDKEHKMDFKYDHKGKEHIEVKYHDEDFSEDYRIKVNENDDKYSYEHKGKDKEEYEHIKDYDKPHGYKDHWTEKQTESKPNYHNY